MPPAEHPAGPLPLVVGVGGAGCELVTDMARSGLVRAQFLAVDCDQRALGRAGSLPRLSLRAAAAAASAEVALDARLGDPSLAVVVAGLGGGTGSRAAPWVARRLAARGALTFVLAALPLDVEGAERRYHAQRSLSRLDASAASMLAVRQQDLLEQSAPGASFAQVHAQTREAFILAASALADLEARPGPLRLGAAGLRDFLADRVLTGYGCGEAHGADFVARATAAALSHPLLGRRALERADGLLVALIAGAELPVEQLQAAATRLAREVPEGTHLAVGTGIDPALRVAARVAVFATESHVAVEQVNANVYPLARRRKPGPAGEKATSAEPAGVEQHSDTAAPRRAAASEPSRRYPNLRRVLERAAVSSDERAAIGDLVDRMEAAAPHAPVVAEWRRQNLGLAERLFGARA